MSAALPCRIISVVTFSGIRSRAFVTAFLKALEAEKHACGPGPSPLECLLYSGHTGVSLDDGKSVQAFNPDGGNLPTWAVMERLRRGGAFPGIVRDDTTVFTAATQRGLAVITFDLLLPMPHFGPVRKSSPTNNSRAGSPMAFLMATGTAIARPGWNASDFRC